MFSKENFKPLKSFSSEDHCFACGTRNPFGLHMRLNSDGKSIMSQVIIPEHLCGWGNLVHGGIITTLLDETMSWAAIHLLRRLILTRTMSIEFLLPVAPNTPLCTRGYVEKQIKSTEALVSAVLYNSDDQVCAKSTGHFALLTPKMMRRLKIMEEATIGDFERFYGEG